MANKRVDPAKTQKKLVEGQAPAHIRKAMQTFSDDVQTGVADHYVDKVRDIKSDLDFGPSSYEMRMQQSRDMQDYSKPLSSYLKTQMSQNMDPDIRQYEPLFRDYWKRVVSDDIIADKDRAAEVINSHGAARMKPDAEPISALEKYYRANPDQRPVVAGEPAKNPFGGSEEEIIKRAQPAAAPFGGAKRKEEAKPVAPQPSKSGAFGFTDMQREWLNGALEEEKRKNRARSR